MHLQGRGDREKITSPIPKTLLSLGYLYGAQGEFELGLRRAVAQRYS